uniref:Uncharacterized protein n=1 Tax=Romanomermis culicivorax TaxID=13658 RepID=A0A915L9A9_ROMCU
KSADSLCIYTGGTDETIKDRSLTGNTKAITDDPHASGTGTSMESSLVRVQQLIMVMISQDMVLLIVQFLILAELFFEKESSKAPTKNEQSTKRLIDPDQITVRSRTATPNLLSAIHCVINTVASQSSRL